MQRIVQDAQVVFSDAQAKALKKEYEAEGYEATYRKTATGYPMAVYLVTAYEKEDK